MTNVPKNTTSDTPKTDEQHGCYFAGEKMVRSDFARQLALKLAAANSRAEYWKAEHLAGNKVIESLQSARAAQPSSERFPTMNEVLAALGDEASEAAIKNVEELYAAHQPSSERDAERYRWLRDRPVSNIYICSVHGSQERTEHVFGTPMLDAAIDSAMKEGK